MNAIDHHSPRPAAIRKALSQATRRVSLLPFTETNSGSELRLRVVVKYAAHPDSGHDGYVSSYDGDPTNRLLLQVVNDTGTVIDAYVGRGGTDRCKPYSDAPQAWWDTGLHREHQGVSLAAVCPRSSGRALVAAHRRKLRNSAVEHLRAAVDWLNRQDESANDPSCFEFEPEELLEVYALVCYRLGYDTVADALSDCPTDPDLLPAYERLAQLVGHR